MKAEYMKGPWEFGYNGRAEIHSSAAVVVRPAGDFPHGDWVADCGRSYDDQAIANARLISCAPCLLECLVKAVAQMKNDLVAIDFHAGDASDIDEMMSLDHIGAVQLIKEAERLIQRATTESNQRA